MIAAAELRTVQLPEVLVSCSQVIVLVTVVYAMCRSNGGICRIRLRYCSGMMPEH